MLTIAGIFSGCQQRSDSGGIARADNTGISNRKNETYATQEKQKAADDGELDSVWLEKARTDAFKIARPAFRKNDFSRQYEFYPEDSSYAIGIDITIGNLFDDGQHYFLLRRHVPWATLVDVYKLVDTTTQRVISRSQGGMTFVRDTILDVNGDHVNDFLVHWYPASGCCRRNIYSVYLNLASNRAFSNEYEFINPTFSPGEKIIRGVEYGHPGEVGLYKYRWNGLEVDTVEFIYPDVQAKGQFIKTRRRHYRPTKDDGTVLKNVPAEYHHIESYDWFIEF